MYHQPGPKGSAQKLAIMKTLIKISILLVVASMLLPSCTLLCSSPLGSRDDFISERIIIDPDWEWVCDLSYCMFPNCSCEQYEKAPRNKNYACRCGHSADYHYYYGPEEVEVEDEYYTQEEEPCYLP